MDTSKVSFVIDGDWKHDHLYFKEMIDRWARRNGRYIFKIDSHEIGDSGSDWYKAQHDIYIAKDEQSLDRLNSMRRLFANESLNKKPMREAEENRGDSIGDFLVKFEIVAYNDRLNDFVVIDTPVEKTVTKEEVIKKFPFTKKMFDYIASEDWEERVSKEHHGDSLWSYIVKTAETKDVIDKLRNNYGSTMKKYRAKYGDIDIDDLLRDYEVEVLNPKVFAPRIKKLSRFLGKKLLSN